MMFNLCSWRDDFISPEHKPGFIRRCRDNVSQIYALLLDIDGTKTLDEAITEYIDYEFLVYSTFGNSENKSKFRLILPLATPLTRQEFDARHDSMCDTFGVDRASFTISQAFYLPCYTSANQDIAFIEHNQAEMRYEALLLPVREISYNTTPAEIPQEISTLSLCIYKTMLTGSNMRYADALTMACILKSLGFSYVDYEFLVQQIAGQDSSLRTGLADLPRLWQQAYVSNIRHDTMINIMQRLNCDMWRFKLNQ
jgi:hypothetical protein